MDETTTVFDSLSSPKLVFPPIPLIPPIPLQHVDNQDRFRLFLIGLNPFNHSVYFYEGENVTDLSRLNTWIHTVLTTAKWERPSKPEREKENKSESKCVNDKEKNTKNQKEDETLVLSVVRQQLDHLLITVKPQKIVLMSVENGYKDKTIPPLKIFYF